MSDIETWYKTLPPFTRYYLSAAVLCTALVSFGVLNPAVLYFDWAFFFRGMQVWRLLTQFLFFGKFSFNFLISMVILVQYCRPLEAHPSFEEKYPEFVWCVMLLAGMLIGFAYYADIYFLGQSMVFAIMYVWSRKDPDQTISLWGFQFKSYQLPFVMMGIHILMGGGLMTDLIGVLAGHIYYFLADVVPEEYGYNLVRAPRFLYSLLRPKQSREYQAFAGRGHRAN